MSQYALRRLLLIPPTLLIVLVMVFLMVALLPGDAVDAAGSRGVGARSQESKEAKRARLGLDRPLPVQLVAWLIGWKRTEGVILATSNGGETWEPASESFIQFVNDLAFVNGREGWAVDTRGDISHTADGGGSWERQAKTGAGDLRAIFMLDRSQGWTVGGGGAIYRTTDGKSWSRLASGVTSGLNGVAFADASTGWVVGSGGTILATRDGGATWTRQQAGVSSELRAITSLGPGTAWVAGAGGVILHTADGGQSWIAQPTGVSSELRDLAFIDERRGFAVGDGGLILATSDAGGSWLPIESGTTTGLTSVYFSDEKNGMAAGEGGTIVATGDGGLSWAQREVNPLRPITRDLQVIAFADPRQGFAAGWDAEWKWGLIGGNMGTSLLNSRSAVDELGARIPKSMEMMLLAMLIAVGVGVPVGVLAAIRQDTWLDYAARTLAVIGLSLPGFWFATLIILLPAVWWSWTPPLDFVSFTDDPAGNLAFYALPALVVGFATQAAIMRMTRATMLEVMRQDYIRTAWSKGLRESRIVVRHALKNAMIPVLTIIGIQIPFIIGETVVIEFIFHIPGIGLLAWNSLIGRDYPILQSVVLFIASLYVFMSLVVDLLYAWLDPRIRFA